MSAKGMMGTDETETPNDADALQEGLESPTGGEEALAQSDIAKNGLAAWERCQKLNGQRCSGDDAKAMILYVLTEGPQAPEAADMSKYLQKIGVKLPGVGATGGNDGES